MTENKNLNDVVETTEVVEQPELQDEEFNVEGDEESLSNKGKALIGAGVALGIGVGAAIAKKIKKGKNSEKEAKPKKGKLKFRNPFYREESLEEKAEDTIDVKDAAEQVVETVKDKTTKKDKH